MAIKLFGNKLFPNMPKLQAPNKNSLFYFNRGNTASQQAVKEPTFDVGNQRVQLTGPGGGNAADAPQTPPSQAGRIAPFSFNNNRTVPPGAATMPLTPGQPSAPLYPVEAAPAPTGPSFPGGPIRADGLRDTIDRREIGLVPDKAYQSPMRPGETATPATAPIGRAPNPSPTLEDMLKPFRGEEAPATAPGVGTPIGGKTAPAPRPSFANMTPEQRLASFNNVTRPALDLNSRAAITGEEPSPEDDWETKYNALIEKNKQNTSPITDNDIDALTMASLMGDDKARKQKAMRELAALGHGAASGTIQGRLAQEDAITQKALTDARLAIAKTKIDQSFDLQKLDIQQTWATGERIGAQDFQRMTQMTDQEFEKAKLGYTDEQGVFHPGLSTAATGYLEGLRYNYQNLLFASEKDWQKEKIGLDTNASLIIEEARAKNQRLLFADEKDWEAAKIGYTDTDGVFHPGLSTQQQTYIDEARNALAKGLAADDREWEKQKIGYTDADGFHPGLSTQATMMVEKQREEWTAIQNQLDRTQKAELAKMDDATRNKIAADQLKFDQWIKGILPKDANGNVLPEYSKTYQDIQREMFEYNKKQDKYSKLYQQSWKGIETQLNMEETTGQVRVLDKETPWIIEYEKNADGTDRLDEDGKQIPTGKVTANFQKYTADDPETKGRHYWTVADGKGNNPIRFYNYQEVENYIKNKNEKWGTAYIFGNNWDIKDEGEEPGAHAVGEYKTQATLSAQQLQLQKDRYEADLKIQEEQAEGSMWGSLFSMLATLISAA